MNRDLEQVSALADGALEGEAFARAVSEIGACGDLQRQWQMVHLVGDVLRSGTHAPCSDPAVFLARLRERMAAQSVARPAAAGPEQGARLRLVRAEAANEPAFRWKMVAGMASVAAAAAIGWAWMGQGGA
ncbi:MAG: sigma-E factor negative regulatory protein, partial [Xenophilus sp.]